MACGNSLKNDIQILEELFPKGHKVFQITAASDDELTCRFISGNGECIMNANITVTYPSTPPIWFAETEDSSVLKTVQNLTNTTGIDNDILRQIKLLVSALCKIYNLEEPAELSILQSLFVERINNVDSIYNDSEYDEEVEDEMHIEAEADMTRTEKTKNGCVSIESDETLQMLKWQKQWLSESDQVNHRLLKDLEEMYCSESFKEGVFKVELVNDNLYEWNVKLLKVYPDSGLHNDLALLKEYCERDYILLNILFKETYPFDPPFVRIVYPRIACRHVLSSGGAICIELLTDQGWSSAYTVEAIILQIAATLVKGKAWIKFDKIESQYSLKKAQRSFQTLLRIHENNCWFTPLDKHG